MRDKWLSKIAALVEAKPLDLWALTAAGIEAGAARVTMPIELAKAAQTAVKEHEKLRGTK